ncbi:LysE family translocator [Neorhizobium galegae]|uniref:LysE family translocator n=1 Tax=Neorhizobium galegae TaxID=399 RepID=A0A6A1TXH8_NEOGA|nr:LysE family translocator [Neorhizobium galegae]KAB1089036.1 LysE family translocator [Neorhizobium galegae]
MTLASLLVFAAALFVAAGSPGPSIAALVARVLSKGYRDVLPFLAAMWVGVAYLLYLAWKMWFTEPAGSGEDLPENRSVPKMFFAGLTVTLGNPKIMMFYVALLPSIIDLGGVTLTGWLELVAAMFLVLVVVDLAWVLLAAKARQFLKSPRAVRIANRVSAGAMASAAAAIATR